MLNARDYNSYHFRFYLHSRCRITGASSSGSCPNHLGEVMSKINWSLVLGCFVVASLVVVLFSVKVSAQEHRHPPQDSTIHEKFYSTWMMPDNRAVSCCHDEDCSPAESKFENGQWHARKVGDEGSFTPIPAKKIEMDRDTPDGRSHLCGRRWGMTGDLTVFCFIPGSGS
jgi:hypothetical protein